MATQFEIDYSIMAGRAYETNRNQNNWFPVPDGWIEFFHVPNDTYPTSSGFEALSFTNGSEIVISFAGTDSKSAGDIAADIGLATGWGSAQLLQAAAYYMEVKAANRGAEITFTGHSLGGGLAALMGLFFNKKALTFDQAPFFASATERIGDGIKSYLLSLKDQYGQSLYTLGNIQAIAPELLSFADSSREARAGNVRGYYVQGESLTNYPYNGFLRIGSQVSLTHGPTDAKPWELHSQALLTAFMLNDDFRLVTNKLTDLLEMIFDKKLYSKPTNEDKENFLDRLVRHEVGNAPGVTEADNMLTRFTDDLKKIAQEGGLTMSNSNLSDALTAFAMQMYYDKDNPNSTNKDKTLFDNTGVAGGLHFDRSDVATNLSAALGYKLYFQKYLSTLPGNETGVITRHISELLDWYIQAGSSSMTATAGTRRAFMLGGNNADNLTGSSSEDLLYGGAGTDMLASGAGADTLIGGAGNDVLNGGLGHDTYEYTIGDGNDLIIDEDKDGELVVHNSVISKKIIALGNFYKSGTDEWKPQNNSNIKIVGNMLYLPDGNAIEFGTSLQSGDFGINLIDIPDDPAAANPVYLDVVDNEHINHQKTPDYGTTANDMIVGGAGNDWVANYSYGGQYGGDDWIVGGAGNDILNSTSPNGNDVLEGDTGIDILFGNSGSNKLYCENPGEMEAILAAGETAQSLSNTGDIASGGEGDDFIYGSNAKDGLFGGLGNDLIVGGGGDDFIYSDAHVYGVNVEQSQTVRLEDNYAGFVDWSYTVQSDAGGTFITALHNVYVDQNSYGNEGDDVIYAGTGSDYVDGGYGDDEIYGGADNDIIFGSAGDDFIEGGTGEDILIGDDAVISGNDYIDGGDGNDYIEGQRGSDKLFGGSGDDAIYGNEDDDYLDGETGNDTLYGNSGNDDLFGGDGQDTIYGGEGDDYIDGEAGANSLYGGAGNDIVFGGDDNDLIEGDSSDEIGDDYLDGGAGNDIIIGAGGTDEIFGGAGGDQLHGDASNVSLANQGDDYIDGAGGDNLLVGYGGNDTLLATEGNDTIYGDAGDDYIDAGDGKNTIYGGAGSDEIYAGADDDQIDAGSGDDYVDAGDGSNIIVGREGNNEIYAGDGADQISGGTGNDYIDAGDGNNIITSGAGDDVVYTGTGDDQIWGGAGQDEIYGGGGDDQLYDEGGDSIIYGGEGSDWIQTTDGNSYFDGGGGNDTLLGGTGNDTIYGGTENDYLQGSSGSDTYVFGRGDGSDTIQNYAADYTTAADILQFGASINDTTVIKENNDLRISINETTDSLLIWDWFSGSPYQIDQIRFSDGTIFNSMHLEGEIANTINGTAANDTIVGENFSDTIYGYAGNDWLYGGGGTNLLDGGDGNDWLYSDYESVNDILIGGAGNDTLLCGSEYVSMMGGTGDDIYRVGIETQVVFEDAGEGIDLVYSDIESYTLPSNVENLKLDYGHNGTGNDLDNTIKGNANQNLIIGGAGDDEIWGYDGNDTLNGGFGTDIMIGGAGNDRYYVDNTRDVVTENADEGTDAVYSSLNYTLGANLENLVLTGTEAINGIGNDLNNSIKGNAAANILTGGDGNDTLTGGVGADIMSGGAGNDRYYVDNARDVVMENVNEGTDAVYSSLNYTLGANLENLVLTGTEAIDAAGNELNNSIKGNASDNILSGGVGDDTLNGGLGADCLIGGLGNDRYHVDNINDLVTENVDEGMDVVYSLIDYKLGNNLENLVLTGMEAINGTGNELNNSIKGNAGANIMTGGDGDDTLNGGVGTDIMNGGTGNDRCYVDNAGDVVMENVNEGTDTVYSSLNYTLGANLENLVLTGTEAINAAGNIWDNRLYGNAAANTLSGDAGKDYLSGGDGDDRLIGESGNDTLIGGNGSDAYFFGRTDGRDILKETAGGIEDTDTLRLTGDITTTEPILVQQNNDLYVFIDSDNYMKIANEFQQTNYGIERLEVADGHYITRADIQTIVDTMSVINNNTGMDVMQKYNAMMADQQYQNILAQSWQQ